MDIVADIVPDLAEALQPITFTDRGAEEVTALIVDAVVAWGEARGWRSYRRAASVVRLPAPYERQHSVVDVAFARPDGPPVVVEVDHGDRRRTVDKLAAEAGAGRVAVWVRWGHGRLAAPDGVHLVALPVTARTGPGSQQRRYSRERDRPAPRHSSGGGTYTAEELDPDTALVLRAYAAFARGDIDAAVRDLAPDVDWVEPDEFPGGGHHRGPAAVAAYLRASYEGWAELHSEPVAHRRGEQIVVVHHVWGVLRDGSHAEATVADVFTVEDGRVVLMMAYADPADAFR
ncbi:nuclear transport factor 2 family protein [Dactylosporangium aurantiacum]|uniref:Nuclear transport factor 2 family protein n=1 Tax=Dactylosporangium aurantiacum TaxID=35754 RepID=A0A9Q9IAF6_9ACTN|nr:nuclear transport factor 2 family protein [Dactylosporangium aurantiacum]MDG6108874.1 nuclear transport factor 2 family protein [Dactylosporangium aurantiacum]UWZ52171.1 nuclear transport factor 2 family protein [Dactylosporangium aurantiacum]